MKKKSILITVMVTVVFAGIVLIQSCAVNQASDADIDAEDGTETVEMTTIEEPESEEERRATYQEIDEMHQRLEEILLDNYDVFNQIVSYLEETPEDYAFWGEDGEIIVRLNDRVSNSPFAYMDLNEIEVAEQIAYVIDELGFVSIHEGKYSVWFNMVSYGKAPIGDTYSQGLICNKSDAGEGRIVETGETRDFRITRIRDEWFRRLNTYYASSPTHTP